MKPAGTVEVVTDAETFTVTRVWSAAGYRDEFAWKPGMEPAESVNERTVLDAARAALTANKTYLGIASPTNAQNLAQIRALTRQINGLIRVLLQDYTGTG